MKYFKYTWNETRGDKFDDWGHSLWYIEVDSDDFPIRQITIYENGKTLKYSLFILQDEYGGLGDQKASLLECGLIECSQIEFEEKWNQ